MANQTSHSPLPPMLWATAAINNLVQQIAALASVAPVAAQTQAAAVAEPVVPAAPLTGNKRSCRELDKVQPASSTTPMDTDAGTTTKEKEEKDDPADTPDEVPP